MQNLDEKIKIAVEEYQCPGCVCGTDTTCYEKGESEACKKHVAGTMAPYIGTFFLGMPKGFNRLGPCDKTKIEIFREFKNRWVYDKFDVPVWKYKDKNGNTIVRGLSPRINFPWIHIFLTDYIKDINCIEITEDDLARMD